jgi:hypothetical protein
MRQLDMKRKQTSAWPWLAGVVLLGLVVWGVTSLLAPPVDAEGPVSEGSEEELAPSALPMPVNPVGITPVRDVRELSPLGQEHLGQRLRAEGEVVATGTDGFWILAGSEVIRVDSEQVVRQGQSVEVQGTLHEDDPARTEQIVSEVLSRRVQAGDWQVVRGVKLVDETERAADQEELRSDS